jgi:membrane protease YdiL (CAAX protease family)
MADEVITNNEPPLVMRVEPPAPKKPRPGLLEAIVWCFVFLGTQIFSVIVTMCVVLGIYAFQANDPGQFLDDQLTRLGNAVAPNTPPEGRPPVPTEIGQSLAYGMLVAQVASFGIIMLVVPRVVGRDWKRQLGFRRPAPFHVVLVILLVPGFMILSGGLQELIVYLTGIKQPSANKALNSTFRQVPWFVTFVAVALGPGFVEEVWCRGFLGRGLCARYGLITGVILTSLLFGILHVDPAYALVTAIMGAYLHFVYLASRSIWVPIILHVVNNGVAVLITLAQVGPAQLDVEPKPLAPIYYLVSFSLVLFASIALWTGRAEVQGIRGSEAAPDWKPEYPGISAPPPQAAAEARLGYAVVSPAAVVLTLVSFVAMIALLMR